MKKKDSFLDFLFIILGGALVAVSVSCFCVPNKIVSGGVTGIATIFNYLFSLPVGTVNLILNIPIFIIGARKFGLKFLYKSIIATVIMSIFIDLFSTFLPVYKGDKLLSCIFGGVLSGLGTALVFMRGSTTGGVDIIAKVVNVRYAHISMGKIIMMLDGAVVILAAIAYQNIENALYAIILIFVQSKAVDALIYGADRGKILIINSKKYEQICERIMYDMNRGVTILDGSGAYTKQQNKVILCAVRNYEASQVHKIVLEIDESAFVVTFEAGEITGEGFKRL